MTTLKRLPPTKTLLLSVDTHMVDAVTKSRSLKAGHAVPVTEVDVYTQTDIVISNMAPYVIQNIKKALIISALGPFKLDLAFNGTFVTGLECSGFFTFFGPLNSAALYLPSPVDPAAASPKLRVACQYV